MPTLRLELLQQMPIFGAIRDDALQRLVEPVATVDVPAGRYFFHEADAADAMYVLERGEVEVLKRWEGRDYVLGRLAAGDCFGEMALIDLFPRSASLRALTDCRAIRLESADLMRLYESDVEQFALIQMNLGREISRRLREADDLLFRARMGELPLAAPDPARP